MNTPEALRALYKALGGSESDVSNIFYIPDLINAIATQAAKATAPELPSVDATDNGSVLKVVDGAWAVGTDETGGTSK